jgi:uncharacterized protein (DUF1810 family)
VELLFWRQPTLEYSHVVKCWCCHTLESGLWIVKFPVISERLCECVEEVMRIQWTTLPSKIELEGC